MLSKENKRYLSIPFSIGIVGIIFASMIVSGSIIVFIKRCAGLDNDIALLLELILDNSLLFSVLYFIRKKKTGIKKINFSLAPNSKWVIPFTIIAALSLSYGITPLWDFMPMPDFMNTILEMTNENEPDNPLITFAIMVIIVPIGEELIYRSIILDGLLDRYSAKVAIIVSALIFSITHALLIQLLPVFLLGLFLGWVYYCTNRSTTHAIILHAILNLSGFLEPYFFREGALVKAVDTWVYISIVIVCNAIFVLCFWQLLKIFRKQKSLQTEVKKAYE
ncbi:MAG: CPBP family intramembrane metalloprotease [Bacteroidales bacterium]|jgi:membrane protease YdiL (CAAX protease family)|nr:CPBP family intramembrane metalloprotease [Bacteroidales bacterium]